MSNQSQGHEGHLTVDYSPETQRATLLEYAGRNIDESMAVNYGMHFRSMAAANQQRGVDAGPVTDVGGMMIEGVNVVA